MKQGNKGLSLVELVTTMAIMAVVSLSIISFLAICLRHYEKAGNEVNLQQESQLAMNQIQELVMDATNGIGYEPGRLFVYNQDTSTGKAEKIELEQQDSKILYTRYTLNADNVWQADAAKEQPFADYISSFSAVLYDKEGQEAKAETEPKEIKQVKVHLDFAWEGQTFSSDNMITLRNIVVASTNVEKIFSDITPGSVPEVRDVVVSPSSIYAWAGSTGQTPFRATVVGNNLTDTGVRWELTNPGAVSEETKITESGALSIAENETQNFTVRAVSTLSEQLGNQKFATANVLVKLVRGLYINSLYRNDDTMTATAYISISGKNFEGTAGESEEIANKLLFGFWCDGKLVSDISVSRKAVEAAGSDRYVYRYLVTAPESYLGKTVVMKTAFQGNSVLLAEESIEFAEMKEKEVTFLRLYKVGNQGLQESEIQAYPGGSFTLRAVAGYSDETSGNINYADSDLSFTITEGSEYVKTDNLKADGTITLKSGAVDKEAVVTVEAEYRGCKDTITFCFRDASISINEKTPEQMKEFMTVGKENAVSLNFTVSGISDYKIECVKSDGMQVSVQGKQAVIYAENAGDYELIFTLIDGTNGCDMNKTESLKVHVGEPNIKYKKWSLWKRKYIYYMQEPSWYVPDSAKWQEYTKGKTLYSLGSVTVPAKAVTRGEDLIKGEYIKIDGETYEWEDGFWVTNRTFD